MTAHSEVAAKIMALIDTMLEAYVTVEMLPANSACGGVAINYTVTDCGQPLLYSFERLLTSLLQLYSYILPALGAVDTAG